MKKSLRFVLSSLFMLLAVSMNAETVVTFEAGVDVGTQTDAGKGADQVSKQGITISVTKGALAAAQYRFAKGQTMTITSTIGNITNVVFTCTASGDEKYGPGNFTDVTSGMYFYEDNIGMWTGNAAEFSMTASANQVRCSSIMVTVDGEGGGQGFEFDYAILSGEITETANQLVFSYTMAYTDDLVVPGSIVCDFANDILTKAVLYMTFPTEEMAKEVYEAALKEDTGKPVLDGKTVSEDMTEAFEGMTKAEIRQVFEFFMTTIKPDDGNLTGNGTLASPYTAADATIVAGRLEDGANSTDSYYIKGKVSNIKYEFSAQYGTATFSISADGTENGQFLCYSVLYLENKSWVDGNTQIKLGDDVIIYGQLTNYKGTPETASKKAYIYSLNGKTTEGSTPEPEVKKVNVAEALNIIAGLEDKAITAEVYQVTGYVVSVTEISAQFGNATFVIADDKAADSGLTIFRIKGFDGQNITNEQLLKVGDLVVVEGKLQKYVKDGEMTPEMAQGGKIISINGKTGDEPGPVEVKDISVEQALDIINEELADGKTTSEEYRVTGFVVGAPDFQRNADGQLFGNVNMTIADEKGGSPTLTVFRAKSFGNEPFTEETIGLLKEGDEVVVQGKLQRYVNKEGVMTPELSNCFIVSINGQQSSIAAVRTDVRQGIVYNLQGQRVANATKGLYIVDGKKVLVK